MWSGWHFLGTDNLGRDILVRTLYGLHTSEQSALLATLLASLIGIALGGIAGYYGGWADPLIMRFGDMFGILPATLQMSFPQGTLTQKSYLLGISTDKGKTWKFADGAGMDARIFGKTQGLLAKNQSG